jgi:hypothetical protein
MRVASSLNDKKAFNSISNSFKTQAKRCGLGKQSSRNMTAKASTYMNKGNVLIKVKPDLETERKKELAVNEEIQLKTVNSQRDIKTSTPKVQILPSLITPKEPAQQIEQVQGLLHDSAFEEIDMRSESSIEVSQEEGNLAEVKKKLNEIAKQVKNRTIKKKTSANTSKLLLDFLTKAVAIIKSDQAEKEQLSRLKVLILNMQQECIDNKEGVLKKYKVQIEKIRQENKNLKSIVFDIEASIVATGTNTAEKIKAPVVEEMLKEQLNNMVKRLKKKREYEKTLLNELSKKDKEIRRLRTELETKDKGTHKPKKGKSEVISKKIQEKFANQVAALNSVIRQKSTDTSKNKTKEIENTNALITTT